MAVCHYCTKIKDIATCGACRNILKIDLVKLILEEEAPPRVYLDENNRNKKGRKSKFSLDKQYEIAKEYHGKKKSLRALAKKYKVTATTIFNIYMKEKAVLDKHYPQ